MSQQLDASAVAETIRALLDTKHERPTLEKVAAELGVSRMDLQRAIHKSHGTTFRRLAAWSSAEHAAKNIAEGVKIDAAIRLAGFINRTHFNRWFRTRFGCCPSEYRSRLISAVSATGVAKRVPPS